MTPRPSSWPAASLRPWTDSVEDIASILAAFGADDMAGQAGEPMNSVSAARRWVEPWIDPDNKSAVAFSIEKDGAAVGHVMASSIDYRNETAWVSYWVTSCVRGAGLASRATAALAGHCLGELGLFRLELAYRVNNPASAAVARNQVMWCQVAPMPCRGSAGISRSKSSRIPRPARWARSAKRTSRKCRPGPGRP
jgi:ribosomal-protein-alanine N-acetyltransferase